MAKKKKNPPKLTPEQRAKALKKAREVRAKRAALRKKIAAGKIGIRAVLNKSKDPVVGKMRVRLLIKSFPGIGEIKTKEIMEMLSIAENRRVQGLGDLQRKGLIKLLTK